MCARLSGDNGSVRAWFVIVALWVTGCECSPNEGPPDASPGADAATPFDGGVPLVDGGATPHVVIDGGALFIDGRPTWLYGGDLHYFRVRAEDFDAGATWAMWAQSLDLMADAGMNLVTTYLPWDYHSPAPGTWDFSGARDVERFLTMACERHFWVVAKPGPLITGEWPRGFGTFGAVPTWWKTAHPDSLAQNSKHEPYNYSLTGASDQVQPSLSAPAYLTSVREWYRQVLPRLKPFLGKCLVALQVDNETNLFWSRRFGDADYSPSAVAHFHAWLATRYGTIGALNARYGTSWTRFEDVEPPTSSPGPTDEVKANPAAADWYWAGQSFVQDYLRTLREELVQQGFAPPNVLFFTNDSPFALLEKDLVLHDTLLHDGRTKNAIGACGLDLYPKQDALSAALQDQPFQADFFTRLYDQENDLATGPQEWVYAAELQGGFYSLPLLGAPDVKPEATESLLMRSVGRGLKGGAFYVIRDGLNLDGSKYDYLAAIDQHGATTPRYEVMARWGRFLATYGADLSFAHAVNNRIAVVTNSAFAAPQGGVLDEMERLTTIEEPAVMGWLVSAGLSPEVVDLQLTAPEQLAKFKVAFYLNPDFQDDASARRLTSFANNGGMLVTMLWPGRRSDDFVVTPASTAFSSLFAASSKGSWTWPGISRQGEVNVAGGNRLTSFWYESFWQPIGAFTPLLYERKAITGSNGEVVAWSATEGARTSAFIGTYVATAYNQGTYYSLSDAELRATGQLARTLAALGGERPLLTTTHGRHLAWVRKSATRWYVFLLNDTTSATPLQLQVEQLAALGLEPAATYRLTEGLRGLVNSQVTGEALQRGLSVPVPPLSGAILVIDPM